MSEMTKEEMKQVAKETLKEWLDERFMDFGRWTFKSLASALFIAVIYFVLKSQGWVWLKPVSHP